MYSMLVLELYHKYNPFEGTMVHNLFHLVEFSIVVVVVVVENVNFLLVVLHMVSNEKRWCHSV